MTEKYLQANGIKLAYDEFGKKTDPVILLIMGLGTQMTAWTPEFCEGLAAEGFRVIRFDNRDIGLSEKMEGAQTPPMLKMAVLSRLKLSFDVPYTLNDMADDAVGLLAALDIEAAHIVGASMGGMIAQIIAAKHPQRTLSLTSIMSSSGRRSLPSASLKVSKQMFNRPDSSEEARLEHSMETWRIIGSPGYRPTDEELREKILLSYRRSFYPMGYVRHMAAIIGSGDRVALLKTITAPTLVIHGKEDALVPVACGIDTAKHVTGANLELIEGMGHDLPKQLYPKFIAQITENASRARASR